MIHSILGNNLSELSSLFFKHKIKRAYAFGSVCRNDFNDQSDVDFLIAFEDGLDPITYGQHYCDLVLELESLLNRPVDLLTEESLKNPFFIKSINGSKELIYA